MKTKSKNSLSLTILERELGMTLIEVIAAFTILAIAGLGLFAIGSISTTGNTRNVDQVAAAALASSKLEDLRTTGFDALVVGSYSEPSLTAGGASGGVFSRSWTVASTTISGISTAAKTLSATVSWTGGGSVTMTTMVVNPSQAFTGITPGITTGFPTVAVKGMEQTQ